MEPYIIEVSDGRFVNLALATDVNAMARMAKVCYVGSTTPVTYTEEESDVLRKALKELKHAV